MKTWLITAAVLAISAHQATANPNPELQALRFLAQAKIAAGGSRLDRAETFYSSGTRVRDDKIDGVYQEWGDYRTMAFTNVETFDGVTSTGGFDGKTAWHLAADGKVMILDGARQASGAKLSGYLDVQGYFFPERFPAKFEYAGLQQAGGKSYDVVSVTPEGIASINLWFDQRTHLLKRLTGQLGANQIQGDIFQNQTVDGVVVMRTALQTMTTPSGAHTESQNVVVYEFKPISPERIAVPK